MKHYAYILDADSGALHKVPRKKFEAAQEEMQRKIESGYPSDSASNEMLEMLTKHPVTLYVDWVERVL